MDEKIIGVLGLVLGIISFGWHVLNAHRKFLHIDLEVTLDEENYVSALTRVENTSWFSKKIGNAILLVGPVDESPIDTAKIIFEENDINADLQFTNDIAELNYPRTYTGPKGRAIIPLSFYYSFYYSENIGIADERITYRESINPKKIPLHSPYSVRFFVAPKRPLFFFLPSSRLHRSTHDSFVIKAGDLE